MALLLLSYRLFNQKLMRRRTTQPSYCPPSLNVFLTIWGRKLSCGKQPPYCPPSPNVFLIWWGCKLPGEKQSTFSRNNKDFNNTGEKNTIRWGIILGAVQRQNGCTNGHQARDLRLTLSESDRYLPIPLTQYWCTQNFIDIFQIPPLPIWITKWRKDPPFSVRTFCKSVG